MATRQEILALTIQVDNAEAKRRVEEFVKGVEGAHVRADPALKGLGSGFGALKTAIAGLGIGLAIQQLDRFMSRAQNIQEVSQGFEFLGKRANFSADALERMTEAGGHEITNLKLMESASQALQLQLVHNEDEMVEMVRVSEALADVVGMDATKALDIFTTGLARQSDRALVQLGIQIDTNRVYEEYARRLNTTVEHLTEVEKRTAFVAAAMDQGREAAKAAGAEALTFSSMWVEAFTAVTNAGDSWLKEFNALPGRIKAGDWKNALATIFGRGIDMESMRKELAAEMGLPYGGIGGGIWPTVGAAGAAGGPPPNVRPSEPDWRDEMISKMGPFPQMGSKLRGIGVDAGPPQFDSIGFDVMEKELEKRQQIEDQMLAMRMDYAEQWSSFAEETQLEQVNNEYERLIEAQERLGGDTAALIEQQEQHVTAIRRQYSGERQEVDRAEANARHQMQVALAMQSIKLMGVLFGEEKKAAIANVIIRTAQGVMAALAKSPPAYWEAAYIAMEGATQLAVVRSASASGGGGGGRGGGGPGAAPTSSASSLIGGSPASSVPMHITIALEGQGFIQSPDEFARLIAKLIEEQLGRAGTIQVVS